MTAFDITLEFKTLISMIIDTAKINSFDVLGTFDSKKGLNPQY